MATSAETWAGFMGMSRPASDTGLARRTRPFEPTLRSSGKAPPREEWDTLTIPVLVRFAEMPGPPVQPENKRRGILEIALGVVVAVLLVAIAFFWGTHPTNNDAGIEQSISAVLQTLSVFGYLTIWEFRSKRHGVRRWLLLAGAFVLHAGGWILVIENDIRVPLLLVAVIGISELGIIDAIEERFASTAVHSD
jgi:hypothetical protein